MTNNSTRDSKGKAFLIRCVFMVIVLLLIFMTTGVAYLIYQSTRGHGLGKLMVGVIDSFKDIFNMDPIVAAWALPLGAGLIAVIGMLVVRHYKR